MILTKKFVPLYNFYATSKNLKLSIDGNEASAMMNFKINDVMFIYPITPSSDMAEKCYNYAYAEKKKNIFGQIPLIREMQSEAGTIGSCQGALSTGTLATTFSCSQGLMLMIPTLYQYVQQLLPGVINIASRSVAGSGTALGGDHVDVLGCRPSGICIISSQTPQEAHDIPLIAQITSLKCRVPFIHFFEGMQVSGQINTVEIVPDETIKDLFPWKDYYEHQKRALNPMHPTRRGSSIGGDVYFQLTETVNPFYAKVPDTIEKVFKDFEKKTGRKYELFEYCGAPDAENLIVIMGGGSKNVEEVVNYYHKEKGEKIGVIKVRVYRPWSKKHFLKVLPKTVKRIAVLDRTQEKGAIGEPLYEDVCTTLFQEKKDILTIGGRFGIADKALTPGMIRTVFDFLKQKEPFHNFTIGIKDDVMNMSLNVEQKNKNLSFVDKNTKQAIFWALGSDGTVGATKTAIKLIGDNTDMNAQASFLYSAHKAGGATLCQLRFGKSKIVSQYPIQQTDYIGLHKSPFIKQFNPLKTIKEGGVFVMNTGLDVEKLEKYIPGSIKRVIAEKKIKFFTVDAEHIAKKVGLVDRINMIMLAVFFKFNGIFSEEKTLELLHKEIDKMYQKKGKEMLDMNHNAIDLAFSDLREINVPEEWKEAEIEKPVVTEPKNKTEEFVKNIQSLMTKREANDIPVSKFEPAGTTPSGTSFYEKRDIAPKLPKWIEKKCIQCNQCSFVCPHAVIRPYILTEKEIKDAPKDFPYINFKAKTDKSQYGFSIQISPKDCTGCAVCANNCPAKALEMVEPEVVYDKLIEYNDYCLKLPIKDYKEPQITVRGSQFRKPLFEFNGACGGCGQTPYVKLLSQIYGDRLLVAGATSCSSVYSSSYNTNPWTTNKFGEGPSYMRSLFENAAELGYGMFVSSLQRRNKLKILIENYLKEGKNSEIKKLFKELLDDFENGDKTLLIKRKIMPVFDKVKKGDKLLEEIDPLSDMIIKQSQWVMGGDGWANDIGFGGLDHIIGLGEKVNCLVLDNENYANTGGQRSKATQLGSITKFGCDGKRTTKKDLGFMAMTYGNVYVASVACGANKNQTLKAFLEAESYPGPSLILAYSPCIEHEIDGGLANSSLHSKLAVETGYWPLYRFDPRLKSPFQLDQKELKRPVTDLISKEARFRFLKKSFPKDAAILENDLQKFVTERHNRYVKLVDFFKK